MSKATLTSEPAPELGPGVRRLVLDCEHATTTAHVISGETTGPVLEVQIVRYLVARHYAAEGCRCTRELRRRYGLVRA